MLGSGFGAWVYVLSLKISCRETKASYFEETSRRPIKACYVEKNICRELATGSQGHSNPDGDALANKDAARFHVAGLAHTVFFFFTRQPVHFSHLQFPSYICDFTPPIRLRYMPPKTSHLRQQSATRVFSTHQATLIRIMPKQSPDLDIEDQARTRFQLHAWSSATLVHSSRNRMIAVAALSTSLVA